MAAITTTAVSLKGISITLTVVSLSASCCKQIAMHLFYICQAISYAVYIFTKLGVDNLANLIRMLQILNIIYQSQSFNLKNSTTKNYYYLR